MRHATSLGAPMSELTALKQRVDQCVRWLPIAGSNDAAAGQATTCATYVGGAGGASEGIRAFEKITLLDAADNALLFDIARTLLTNWRNTDMGPSKSSSEDNVRRIAAQKLGEEAVFDSVSSTLAVQTLSSAGRIESSNPVKLAIVNSLYRILKTRDIPATVRTEAITTLKILADPNTHPTIDVNVLNAARGAVQDLDRIGLEIGPVTVTLTKKPRSPYFVPVVATVATAALAAGVLTYMFWPSGHHALSGAGPLRRKAEAALRQRRGR